jgi:hypothetical protein
MVLLATYIAMLHRLTGQPEVIVGTPWRGRQMPEADDVMGPFVNVLPLRLKVHSSDSFTDVLQRTRRMVLDAFANPDVPLERLIRDLRMPRDESRPALYQTFFSFQDARERIRHWGPLEQEQVYVFQRGTAEDLGLWFLQHNAGLSGGLTFNTDIIGHQTAIQWGQMFEAVLETMVTSPDALVNLAPTALTLEPGGSRPGSGTSSDGSRRGVGQRPLLTARTSTERAVTEVWNELLGVSDIDVSDNFFDIGGHSLLAMQAVDRIERRLGRRLHVRHLIFETLEQVAARLDRAEGDSEPGRDVAEAPARSTPGWLGRVAMRLGLKDN